MNNKDLLKFGKCLLIGIIVAIGGTFLAICMETFSTDRGIIVYPLYLVSVCIFASLLLLAQA